jgi:hypothetical protein
MKDQPIPQWLKEAADKYAKSDYFGYVEIGWTEIRQKEINAWLSGATSPEAAKYHGGDAVAFLQWAGENEYVYNTDDGYWWKNKIPYLSSELYSIFNKDYKGDGATSHEAARLHSGVNQDEWISVDDDVPNLGEFVLVNIETDTVLKGRLMNNGWAAMFLDGERLTKERKVTHWRPLPSPPINDKP